MCWGASQSIVEQHKQDGGQEQVLVTVQPGGKTEKGALKGIYGNGSLFFISVENVSVFFEWDQESREGMGGFDV